MDLIYGKTKEKIIAEMKSEGFGTDDNNLTEDEYLDKYFWDHAIEWHYFIRGYYQSI